MSWSDMAKSYTKNGPGTENVYKSSDMEYMYKVHLSDIFFLILSEIDIRVNGVIIGR